MNTHDTIVIGAGLSGLMSANLLAEAQKNVKLLAHGIGAIALASGAIDVLGYQPIDARLPLENPFAALDDFLASRPMHPYRLTGADAIRRGLEALKRITAAHGLPYIGETEKNLWLPTALGAIHPAALAPQSLAQGDVKLGGRMLLVGFEELRDFYPDLMAENLNAQKLGVRAKVVSLRLPAPADGKMNITPIELAHAFDRPDFRQRVLAVLKPHTRGFSRIGFPAVLGVQNHPQVLADLESALGKKVFEISTLPPSVPGRRLFEALKANLLANGGEFLLGINVVDGEISGGRVTHIRTESASRLLTHRADTFVLATGSIFGGGVDTALNGSAHEPIFGLPVLAPSDRHQWFTQKFTGGQPVAEAGVRVNARMNPVQDDGSVIAENLFIAGAQLAGFSWTDGRTGGGVALASAVTVESVVGAVSP